MEYRVIQDSDLMDVERQVNEAVEVGWKPLGGIQTVVMSPKKAEQYIVYSQAMTKKGV